MTNFAGVAARLDVLRRIHLDEERRHMVQANRFAILAAEAQILTTRELLRFASERRFTSW